jgi:ActR/RegA family two-component response regulator
LEDDVTSPHRTTSSPAILVVDDDRVVARSLTRALVREGYQVATCHSATEASGLQADGFAAAVIDLHLPDGDGLCLAEELLGGGRVGAVIYYSGSTDRAELASASRNGRFVSKHRGAEAVLDALRELPRS